MMLTTLALGLLPATRLEAQKANYDEARVPEYLERFELE